MKALTVILLLLISGFSVQGQTFNPFYATVANSCDEDSVNTYLQQFEDLGIKELNDAALDNTKNWIIQKYQDWGYTDIVEDDFNVFGNNTMTNIIVTKTGTVYPDTYVIIDGHYDTKDGPGANDNGSGTAILLELARLIKDIPTEYSIKFIHFSGEEIGLEGSEHYVENVAIPTNMDIKVVFNIDQVGGTGGMNNNTIICERDQSPPNTNNAQSAVMTDELATCTQLYSTLQTEISFAFGSDYVPFMQNGYVVTGFYEKNASPYTHSIQDSIVYMDLPYLYQVTKASMGALLHYAVAYEEASVFENTQSIFRIHPNPVHESVAVDMAMVPTNEFKVSILNFNGAIVSELRMKPGNKQYLLNLDYLDPGAYLLQIDSEFGTSTRKFLKN